MYALLNCQPGTMFDAQPARSSQHRMKTMDPHILQANGSNFINVRDVYHWSAREQPMLLTAWTQTTGEDFELLRTLDTEPNIQSENRALHEKVRYLESKLQEHTDLLSQIHATSARMQQVTATPTTFPPPPLTRQPQILSPPSSVIGTAAGPTSPPEAQPIQQQQRTEVIDYKIINGTDADAIEIRLAAESLNSLSTSADSDRLEICLGNDDQQQQHMNIKRESFSHSIYRGNVQYNVSTSMAPQPVPKRCKMELKEHNSIDMAAPAPQLQQVHYKLPTRRSNSRAKETSTSDNVMISIGPNNTCVPASIFENINWNVSSLATRKLLVAIFERETLATHSMTGKPSPAFKDQQKPLKQMLDPLKIQDIIFAVTRKSNVSEKEVRNAITTKCADENKMMKIQKGKRCSVNDKENIANMTI